MNYRVPDKVDKGIPHMIRVIAAKGREIPGFISFAIGNPAAEAIPMEIMQQAVRECADDNPMQYLQYGGSEGYPKILEQTTEWLQNKKHLPRENREILMLSGSGQGLGLAPRTFCREGDEVYVEEFSYTLAMNACLNCGCKLIAIPMDEYGMIPEKLDEAAYAGHGKMIYLNPNFQNPTGNTIPLFRRKEIYEVARKHNLLIYEDDPYGDIRFKGEPVPAFASFDEDGRVIYAGSYSKTLSAGMRVGYLYAEKKIMESLRKIKNNSEGQIAYLNQMVISKTLEKIDYEKHIAMISSLYQKKCTIMIEALHKYVSDKIKILEPEGGMFLWITFPEGTDLEKVTNMALERGIGIVPGSAFAANQKKPGTSFRLNYTFVSEEKIEQGIKILGEISHEICD